MSIPNTATKENVARRKARQQVLTVIGRIPVYALLVIGAVVMMTPFVWMFLSSFKPLAEMQVYPPVFLPKNPTLSNFIRVFEMVPFGLYYFNSAFTTVIPTVITVFTSSMAGFGFAKYRFVGRTILFWIILSTMMIPGTATIVSLYIMIYRAGLVDTYTGIIIVHLSSAFGIFMMRQFIISLPDELLDAARIDGATEFRIYFQIILPLTKPALATLTLFTFMGNWGSYVWPLIVVNSDRLKTLQLAIPYFSGQYFSFTNLIYAASLMAVAPVLILYLLAQRFFVQGIALTGLKS